MHTNKRTRNFKLTIMRLYFTIMTLLCAGMLTAQTTADFESFSLSADSFLNGSDGSMGFSDGNISLPNEYDAQWDSWTGWAISSVTDTTTAGYENQFSCISGGGAEGSATYAVSYIFDESVLYTTGAAEGGIIEGFYLNNSTYAYLSMRDGDAIGKRFGGEDGDDPDFFYLCIKEKGDRAVPNDSLIVYLADFRSDDNSEDYILDEWTYVDLSHFGNVDSLSFTLHSSDNGMFGMNTPAYFCIDNFVTADSKSTATNEFENQDISVYPNPTFDYVEVTGDELISSYVLYDIYGSIVLNKIIESNMFRINLSSFPNGNYLLRTHNILGGGVTHLIVKQ